MDAGTSTALAIPNFPLPISATLHSCTRSAPSMSFKCACTDETCPSEGPLFEEKNRLRRAVRKESDGVQQDQKEYRSTEETDCLPPEIAEHFGLRREGSRAVSNWS